MSKPTLVEATRSGKVLVSDGAWGTFLQSKGLRPGECPELWALERPEDLKEIAASYFAAGSDMVQCDSFGGCSLKLAEYGLAERAAEINRAAARLSAEAAAEAGGDRWVIASVGPTGKMLLMGDVTEEEIYETFKQQATALAEGGADAICVGTMSDLEEARLAVRAARENTDCEVIATFTFEKTLQGEFRTMMGVSPSAAATAMIEAGAHIIGSNCGNGIERMVDIVREMRQAAPETPILVHANAGLPQNIDGKDVFPESPADMAGQISDLVDAGANIVGGCCGTTPEHIRAIRSVLSQLRAE